MFDKKYIDILFSSESTIKSLLQNASNPRLAREFIRSYLNEFFTYLYRDRSRLQHLEWELQMSCLLTFRRIVSVRSEKLSNFSLVKLLWNIAQNNIDQLPEDLSNGFFEELIHIFRGILGKSEIYENESFPEFTKLQGRDAAIARSKQLDMMAEKGTNYIKQYKTGLLPDVIESRQINKKRIMRVYNASEQEWNDYLWQIKHVIRHSADLEKLINLSPGEKNAIDRAKGGRLPFGITPYYVSLMDKESHRMNDHAIRAQVIPPTDYVDAMLDYRDTRYCQFDFMLEHDTSPEDLITRRYPRICILKPYNTCSQICVYCQRNWEIDDVLDNNALASQKQILKAIDWIGSHPAIEEVLVTGGDPLVMDDDHLNFVLSHLAKLDQLDRIRIGTRTPVVLPQRITDKLVKIISQYHVPGKREVVVVTHYSHPYEVTPDSMQAVQKFKRQGISVYNQTVFTVENSRRYELVALRRALRLIGVDPYYTFNTKGKKETKSYRVPMARLMQEIREEARLMPGTVRTDEPVYNVPRLGKNYIRARQNHSLITIMPDGRRVYEFHPWEKNLSLADTYIDIDVSIYDYLQELKKRGEDIDEYKTIWYYF